MHGWAAGSGAPSGAFLALDLGWARLPAYIGQIAESSRNAGAVVHAQRPDMVDAVAVLRSEPDALVRRGRPQIPASAVAKASEQNRRPKVSASPPRSAAAPPRKPMPFRPSQAAVAPTLPQAAAPSVLRQPEPQPQATVQPQVEAELSSVPRPPMPVH
jgi:hypothetical protein